MNKKAGPPVRPCSSLIRNASCFRRVLFSVVLKALVFQSSLRMNLPLPLYTFRKSAPSGSVCRLSLIHISYLPTVLPPYIPSLRNNHRPDGLHYVLLKILRSGALPPPDVLWYNPIQKMTTLSLIHIFLSEFLSRTFL